MFQGIVFDLDDTLYNQLAPFKRALAQYIDPLPESKVAYWYKRSREISDREFGKLNYNTQAIHAMQIKRIKEPLVEDGYDISDDLAWQIQLTYEQEKERLTLEPHMATLLAHLKEANVPLGLLTNGESHNQRGKITCLNLDQYFPKYFQIVSEEVGITKPDPGIFNLMAKRLALPASDLLYIGDNFYHDIVACTRAGYQGAWLNHRDRYYPEAKAVAAKIFTHFSEVEPWVFSALAIEKF